METKQNITYVTPASHQALVEPTLDTYRARPPTHHLVPRRLVSVIACMCLRKIFIHHRCGHKITELMEPCDGIGCAGVAQRPIITNQYTCVVRACMWYGQF